MLRAIVFAAVCCVLLTEAVSWREALEEREESELPNQITENVLELSPEAEKHGPIMRRSKSKCPDDPDCFVGLMGRRSIKRTASGPVAKRLNIAKILRGLQNYNLNPRYAE